MQTGRRAVIDIGTNSVKLLVADVAGFSVTPVWEGSHQTRLGQGFYQTQRLQPARIEETARAVADFGTKARESGAGAIRVIATSAAREARNPEDLAHAISNAAGLTVQIISGEQEAELAFRGICTDPSLKGRPVLLLEVGGGSTQFIIGHGGHAHFLKSSPAGSVRLRERFPHADPPKPSELGACLEWLVELFASQIHPDLQPALDREAAACGGRKPFQIVGTGGTASILGCMEAGLTHFDRAILENTRLSRERVRWHVEHLWALPLEERKRIAGLPANRADIILFGALIYEAALNEFGFDTLRVSTRGLRFGAVLEA